MKIKNLKINNFGKLKNREINFDDHINIIYGKNESGKSTLLKFIIAMFYGLSKNKNGKDIPDYEKFTPWTDEDFSGKIKYELQNGDSFEVFRQFKKKSPQIYDKNLNEISKQFNIDKNSGNRFFIDQTGVEEDLFSSTIVSFQDEVKLDDKAQSTLIQKLSNLMVTGEDTVSFNRIMSKLNKRELEEIGTLRSQDRPINVITKRMKEIQDEKEYLSNFVGKKYDLEETKQNTEQEIKEEELKIEILKKIKQVEDKDELEKEKIRINESTQKEYEKKINELSNQKTSTNIEDKENNTKSSKDVKFIKGLPIKIVLISIIAIFLLLSVFAIKNNILTTILSVLLVSSVLFTLYRQYKKKPELPMPQNINNLENQSGQIEIFRKTKEHLEKERALLEDERIKNKEYALEAIRNEYLGIVPIKTINDLLSNKNASEYLETIQNRLSQKKLKIQSIGLDQNNITPKLENLASLEEEYVKLEEQYEILKNQKEAIDLAKQEIENAYYNMKKQITPKFTNTLSKIMENITQGKYKNIKLDEQDGIMVEVENGNYASIEYLSIGTIEQLYLSLRLSAQDKENISKEILPIMLDEAFSYYDEERLQNILTFLNNEYPNRQILIFTCTDREKDILNKMNIPYNLVTL